jgi:hypothetical protein
VNALYTCSGGLLHVLFDPALRGLKPHLRFTRVAYKLHRCFTIGFSFACAALQLSVLNGVCSLPTNMPHSAVKISS